MKIVSVAIWHSLTTGFSILIIIIVDNTVILVEKALNLYLSVYY